MAEAPRYLEPHTGRDYLHKLAVASGGCRAQEVQARAERQGGRSDRPVLGEEADELVSGRTTQNLLAWGVNSFGRSFLELLTVGEQLELGLVGPSVFEFQARLKGQWW